MRFLYNEIQSRRIKVKFMYEDIEVKDFHNIVNIVFVVDDIIDKNKTKGMDSATTLFIECFNTKDKKRKAELTLIFLKDNIKDLEIAYIRNDRQIRILNKN